MYAVSWYFYGTAGDYDTIAVVKRKRVGADAILEILRLWRIDTDGRFKG